MAITPAPPGVVVVALVAEIGTSEVPIPGPPAWTALNPLELSRGPTQHEYLVHGGDTIRVLSVRHLSGDVAAELRCERVAAAARLESAIEVGAVFEARQ